MVLWFLCLGTPVTGNSSGFKASQNAGPGLKVSSDRLRESGNRTCCCETQKQNEEFEN